MRQLKTFAAVLPVWLALAAMAATGCGDPPLAARADASVTDGATADFSPGGIVDGASADSAAAADSAGPDSADAAEQDAQAPDDGGADTAAADASSADQGQSDAEPAGPDVGWADFSLVSSDPGNGAIDVPAQFVAKLKFSTALKAAAATSYTITVTSQGGAVLPCTFAVNGAELTISAKQAAPLATRVDVVLGSLVQSAQGVPLQETKLAFYTAGPANMGAYADAAARFAPQVRQAIADPSDYLRSVDFDNNWQTTDNVANQGKFLNTAEVTWAAVETRSHLYLTYAFYWPARKGVPPGVALQNDVAGLQVVVERKTGLPAAAATWFKAKSDEPMWLWVASETGWPSKSNYIRAFEPRDKLFPAESGAAACQPGAADPGKCPRRFLSFLTAASHQSCWWGDAGSPSDQQCVASDLVKAGLKLVLYGPGPKATEPATPTVDGVPATYLLRPLLTSWWLHRDESGPTGLFADTQFKYAPADARPMGSGQPLGSRFNSALDTGDFGRPPWAWQWHPTALSASYYDLPRGMPFFDPAWVLWNRLGGKTATVPAWDPATKSGFSTDYCFNPFLGIDLRDTPQCQP